MEFSPKKMKQFLLLITFTGLLAVALVHSDVLIGWGVLLYTAFSPVVVGFGFAFVLRVPLNAIERLLSPLFEKHNAKRLLRSLSILLTLAFLTAIVAFLVILMIPEIDRSRALVIASFPSFIARVLSHFEAIDFISFAVNHIKEFLDTDWASVGLNLLGFLTSGGIFGSIGTASVFDSTVSIATSLAGNLYTFVLGFVFSIYFLVQKEKLARNCKQVLYAILAEKHADRIVHVGNRIASTFADFIAGQCIDSTLLALIMYISMSILGLPYALMISVLIGVTSFIPIFGAFIGCTVGTVLILIADPMQAVWFLVLFLVVQQIEGNFIYPRVVGDSVGLPAVFVLMAVTLGGSLMGVLGMIIFIPLGSVCYQLLGEFSQNEVKQRKIEPEKLE